MKSRVFFLMSAPASLAFITVAIVLLLAASQSALAAPGILYVAPGGACGSALPCFSTVQAAVDAAEAGDEIRIAAGDYYDVNEYGGLSQVVYITKTVSLHGGYTTANWTIPDPATNLSNLNAMVSGRVIYIAGEGITITLDGLHISYGNANGLGGASDGVDAGGGVYVHNASLTLRNSWVLSSTVPGTGVGGGLYVRGSAATVSNSTFQGNAAGNGGGVYLHSCAGRFENNAVLENKITFLIGIGTGMEVVSCDLTIQDNTFEGNSNTEGYSSAALAVRFGNVKVLGNHVTGNTHCGGINGYSQTIPSRLVLDGNMVSGNSGGIGIAGGVYLTMTNNIVEYSASRGVVIDYGAYPAHAYLARNWIHHNISYGWGSCGAGLYAGTGLDYPITIIDNTIQDNKNGVDVASGGSGGGVCVNGDTVTLIGNIIQRNSANNVMTSHGYGGGIYLGGDAVLINNIITNNSAVLGGGGLAIRGTSPTLYHNTIADNTGIGILVAEDGDSHPAQPEIYNSIISGHDAGVFVSGEELNVARIDGVLWWNNITDKDGTGTAFILNAFTGDPAFVDSVNGNYHISSTSEAIGKASKTVVYTDIDHEPRLGTMVDLGADEYWAPGELKRVFLPLVMR